MDVRKSPYHIEFQELVNGIASVTDATHMHMVALKDELQVSNLSLHLYSRCEFAVSWG